MANIRTLILTITTSTHNNTDTSKYFIKLLMTRFHRNENIHREHVTNTLILETEAAYCEASVSNYLVFKYLSWHVLITSEIRIVKPVGHPLIIDVALLKAGILVHSDNGI